MAQLHAASGASVLKQFPAIGGLMTLEAPNGMSAQELLARYRGHALVEYAELDYRVSAVVAPNDPYFSNGTLWGLNNTGQNGGTNDADIDAPEGWNVLNSASNVIVAVTDTGIWHTHEDLATNMWRNPGEIPNNGIDDDGNGFVDDVHGINAITSKGTPGDDHGHGTHVAGTIGAAGNNGKGVVGVAWRVQLMACKFLDSSGSGWNSDAITCIDYARAHGASIISASWGGGSFSQALYDAIARAQQDGILFIAAAGNNSINTDDYPFYPADYELGNIVSVAATTRQDGLAYFSNFGSSSVDLGAPGLEIISTWLGDGGYNTISGTSMATPHVSGVFALMKARFPTENYLQLMNRVFKTVDPIPALAGICRTGGRVNLFRALGSTSSQPGNDDFERAIPINPGSFSIPGITAGATRQPGEPVHAGRTTGKSIWWRWNSGNAGILTVVTAGASADTIVAVYTGDSVSNLTEVSGYDGIPPFGTYTRFEAGAGTNYWFAVDGTNDSSVVLKGFFWARPPNDQFAARMAVTGTVATVVSSNWAATVEPGEPLHAGIPGEKSVWWSWTPIVTGPATINTAGSDFDTLLAVYTGTALTNLTLIAENDNEPNGAATSEVTFNATAGTTYQIAVDGAFGAEGQIVLNTPPANDRFANRAVLTSNAAAAVGFNLFASREPGEPNHAGNVGGHSLWWTWTAPTSGVTTVTTLGSTFDTLLAIYTNATLASLSLVASNDDDPFGGTASRLTFNAIAGRSYQIAVDGKNGAFGSVQLNVGGSYLLTDLGIPPGWVGTAAYGMNNNGTVVGVVMGPPPTYPYHAFIWTASTGIQLLFEGDDRSQANDVNDSGQVVGFVTFPGQPSKSFLWQNGVAQLLDGLWPYYSSEAYAINNPGEIVGWSYTQSGDVHGYHWKEGVASDLGALGTERSWAYAINNLGFIGGYTGPIAGAPVRPVVWKNGVMTNVVMPPGVIEGEVLAVNEYAQAAGYYRSVSGYYRAFLWNNGLFTDLGGFGNDQTAQSQPDSMNTAGQMVGWDQHVAILYDKGKWTDLNSLVPPGTGWNFFYAYEINEFGQIVGVGTLNGTSHAFLLTPVVTTVLSQPFVTSPRAGDRFFTPADVPMDVTFVPENRNVTQVQFFAGTNLLGLASQPPFSFVWTNAPPGDYSLTAVASFAETTNRTSPAVPITLELRPPVTARRLSGEQLQLAWPVTTHFYSLLYATNLTPPVSWQSVTNTPLTTNGERRVTIGLSNVNRFFKLIRR